MASVSTPDLRVSPPNTPISFPPKSETPSGGTPSSDDSSIIDLSFDYVRDIDGNLVRISKGSNPESASNHSSPPTPDPSLSPPPFQHTTTSLKSSSPTLLNSPVAPPRRGSLSRSESAYPILTKATDRVQSHPISAARSFQRVGSGPALLSSNAGTNASKTRNPLVRRVTMEEPLVSGRKPLVDVPVPQRDVQPSTQSAQPARRQIGLGTKRTMKSTGLLSAKYAASASAGTNFDRISESEGEKEGNPSDYYPYGGGEETDTGDDDYDPPPASAAVPMTASRQRSYGNVGGIVLNESTGTRPRRSASLSDANAHDDRYSLPDSNLNPNAYHARDRDREYAAANGRARPGTSLGLNSAGSAAYVNGSSSTGTEGGSGGKTFGAGPRRIPVEERERQEMDLRAENNKYWREAEEAERRAQAEATYADQQAQAQSQSQAQEQARQSPSPTHVQSQSQSQGLRPPYGHKRRDSDTLRNVPYQQTGSGSEMPLPTPAVPARMSPSGRHFGGGISGAVKHRRSPTAPEPPTTSSSMGGQQQQQLGKTWAAGDGGMHNGRDQNYHAQQQQQQAQAPPPLPTPAPTPAPTAPAPRHMIVNKKAYARLDMIGKGGTSRVFRVMNHANELYAIKRVSLDKTDAETMSGYMNEIALLKRLNGNSRIIRLIDSEVKAGPGGSKGHLLLVMECGEIDLARLLQEQQKEPMNMVWVAYYWQQMLQAVHVIHEEKIVHSDLKPANFVLVRGQLKLIDFGIANAIANDTTNIQRDHQIGTVNYMSPEAIELPDGMRRLKVGRQSDVWSLGCILYQMIYGHPPFQHLSVYHKMKAIPSPSHVIDFPEYATPSLPTPRSSSSGSGTTPPKKLDHLKRKVRGDVIRSMKSCLLRNPKERSTIPELLEQDWLAMKEPEPPEPSEPPVMKDLLRSDETVINPYYMRQLLDYGMKLGHSQGAMDQDSLLREAERLVAELKALEQ